MVRSTPSQSIEVTSRYDKARRLGLSPLRSSIHRNEIVFTKGDDNDIMFIEIIKQDDDSHIEEPEVGENAGTWESEVEYF
ncbi:hypothetical protein Tco_1317337 [Tanacetum coccineum]